MAQVLQLGVAKHLEHLEFRLPPALPQETLPLQVQLRFADGRPAVGASVTLADQNWPRHFAGQGGGADATGRVTVPLTRGEFYNVYAIANTPGPDQSCGGPVAVVAEPSLPPITIIINGFRGSCLQRRAPRP